MRAFRLTVALALGAPLLFAADAARSGDPEPDNDLAGLWKLRFDREGFTPRIVTGHLAFENDDGFEGSLYLNELAGWNGIPMDEGAGTSTTFGLTFRHPAVELSLGGEIDDDVLAGTSDWTGKDGQTRSYPFTARRVREPLHDGEPAKGDDRVEDPSSVGLRGSELIRLLAAASDADTDRVVIIKDGRVVIDRDFGHGRRPCHIMSITKAVSVLAVPLLIGQRKIKNLDQPLSKWLPEWKKGDKKKATLRHLLTHTSGLRHDRQAHELNNAKDVVKLASGTELADPPGTNFSYNNRAMALLAEVVAKAAGSSIDAYLGKRLFDPLGCGARDWTQDDAGNYLTYAGLNLEARDLARVAQLLVDGGKHGKKQLVSAAWLDEMQRPGSELSENVGLIWWLRRDWAREKVVQTKASLATFEQAGFDAIEALAPLTGKEFDGRQAYFAELRRSVRMTNEQARLYDRLLNQGVISFESEAALVGLYHTGDLGQWVIAYPEWSLVAVRLRDGRRTGRGDEATERRKSFGAFPAMVEAAVRR